MRKRDKTSQSRENRSEIRIKMTNVSASEVFLFSGKGRAPACVSEMMPVLALCLSTYVNLHMSSAPQTHTIISEWNACVIFRGLYMCDFLEVYLGPSFRTQLCRVFFYIIIGKNDT